MSDDKKVIFSMQKLSKTYPGADKQVLKNIYLSFFYGAKIGILGLNGSGKSSLLKIIAGVDKNYQGDVVFQPGYTVGYLEQEPHLDETKTVIDIVREGAAETFHLLRVALAEDSAKFVALWLRSPSGQLNAGRWFLNRSMTQCGIGLYSQ